MEYGTITISNTNEITSTTTYTEDWDVVIIENDSFGIAPGICSVNWYCYTGTTGPTGCCGGPTGEYVSQHSYIISQEEIIRYKEIIRKRSQQYNTKIHNTKIQRWLAILHRRSLWTKTNS
jgi:hypothetical protein